MCDQPAARVLTCQVSATRFGPAAEFAAGMGGRLWLGKCGLAIVGASYTGAARRWRPRVAAIDAAVQDSSSSRRALSMNAVSTSLLPPPAKCPHTPGMTRNSAFFMNDTSYSSSSGQK